ncbi:uncharacterized protein RHIMIDRAFT_12601 [Rhizopus microsporus ATCC 52813]|uniref:Uncharacterized protein n=2 Tax=Rhizopus microsporus TaxID=58291 RepID=A0A2G4T9Y0_RHIZD|nr:uncharacterized protein RHIMIDRAFT_12601 [Rhizopus microsporus ATCC 52813]PHZ17824.1 hypothetical protein RHIMIDRAFT_12601 [Rhizopus microsporus ATCC 52813]
MTDARQMSLNYIYYFPLDWKKSCVRRLSDEEQRLIYFELQKLVETNAVNLPNEVQGWGTGIVKLFKQYKNKLSLKYNPLGALRSQEILLLVYHYAAIELSNKYKNNDPIVCYKIIADLVGKSNNWFNENITEDTMVHQYLATFLDHIFCRDGHFVQKW